MTTTPITTPRELSPVDAIWSIIQSQSKEVKQAIFLRIEAERRQHPVVNEIILQQLEDLEPGPAGFLKLDSILPPSNLSAEELLQDAYKEKYGI